tara:strand:+ start:672 stop:917 length:246 start_codon:yes stop_codon:yes gene_type:complete
MMSSLEGIVLSVVPAVAALSLVDPPAADLPAVPPWVPAAPLLVVLLLVVLLLAVLRWAVPLPVAPPWAVPPWAVLRWAVLR